MDQRLAGHFGFECSIGLALDEGCVGDGSAAGLRCGGLWRWSGSLGGVVGIMLKRRMRMMGRLTWTMKEQWQRKKMMVWMGQGMGGMNCEDGPPQGFFGSDMRDDGGSSLQSEIKPWRFTMGQQETVAMALAHSLSCGMALIWPWKVYG